MFSGASSLSSPFSAITWVDGLFSSAIYDTDYQEQAGVFESQEDFIDECTDGHKDIPFSTSQTRAINAFLQHGMLGSSYFYNQPLLAFWYKRSTPLSHGSINLAMRWQLMLQSIYSAHCPWTSFL